MQLSDLISPVKGTYCFLLHKIGRRRKDRHQKSRQGKPWRNRMGQEESTLVDENTPPLTLKSRSVEAIADFINSGKAKRIVVLVRSCTPFTAYVH